ncbi:OLC1v1023573C1 [Oldenlandia corymbosa var. corymbosa]|uniref:OLC1v1023573C1 n=1 Tax=Oldenlandia corymbosa var. corymbosa TaxID=529605 RepID=A0AAV1C3W5_OLDCO|nr:OLC1v1023573C1 [Oldenlandia corymbosa var. corymbosa]
MAFDLNSLQPLLLSLAIALTAFALFLSRHKKLLLCHRSKKQLPPGELGFPWIGETLDFYKAQKNNKMYQQFVQPRIQKYGKTFKTKLMGSPTVVVSGAEANKFFLSNEFKLVVSSWPSSSVQLMGSDSIMEKQGEAHRHIRGIIATSLSNSGLESMVPKICQTVESHFEAHWKGQDIISLYRKTRVLTFTIVLECMMGIEVKPNMLGVFERVLEGAFSLPLNFPGSVFWRAKKARKEIEKMLLTIVRQKREEIESQQSVGGEGGVLIFRLIMALIRDEMTEKEVVDNVVLLVFAAHDTTSFAIAMTFRMLAHHPDCYSRLLQEHVEIQKNKKPGEFLALEDIKKMNYTWQVARESMRLFPPIFGSFRKAIVDIEYDGYIIPKGWKVLWTAYGTHYESEYFEDPLSFNPSRFEEPIQPYAYLPFGGGPRQCAGYQLAKLNILILIHLVVTQYDWSLVNPEEPILVDPLPFPSQGMPIRISPKLQ